MNAITDDEIGAMFQQDLRRRADEAAPALDLDAVIQGGRRRIIRRTTLVAVAATGALAMIASITLPSVVASRTASKSVSVQPATSEAPSVTPSPESAPATTRRISRNLHYLLLDNGIHPVGDQPAKKAASYFDPHDVLNAHVVIDRANGGAGGIGLFVTVQRTAATAQHPDTGSPAVATATTPPCAPYRLDHSTRSVCSMKILADGTTLETITDLNASNHSVGGVVIAHHPDGIEIVVGTAGGKLHRWPSGVNISVLQKLASSPLLNP